MGPHTFASQFYRLNLKSPGEKCQCPVYGRVTDTIILYNSCSTNAAPAAQFHPITIIYSKTPLLSFLHAHFRPGTSVLPRYPRSEGPSGFGECLIWTPVDLKSLRYRPRIGLRVERLGSSLRASAPYLGCASRESTDDSRKLPLRRSSEVTNSNIRTMPWNLFTTSH